MLRQNLDKTLAHASGVCSAELIRYIRIIGGESGSHRLQVVTLADKIAILCLNTKLRGCRVTELAMMSWKPRASCW
ncbi:MAG: hypothetical protein M3O82_06540, partial [Verrucomicrobiota bacterium]|nr:hypothetical protein [Verrucomicrobiota bacterium]